MNSCQFFMAVNYQSLVWPPVVTNNTIAIKVKLRSRSR